MMTKSASTRHCWPQLVEPTEVRWYPVSAVAANSICSIGLRAPFGALCKVRSLQGAHEDVIAEVIGLQGDSVTMMPLSQVSGVSTQSQVSLMNDKSSVHVSKSCLGGLLTLSAGLLIMRVHYRARSVEVSLAAKLNL